MPVEMNQVDQDDNGSLESKGTDTKQGSENRPEELASNNLPSEIKMKIINVNNETDLENAIDNFVKPYNISYNISAIPVSSWDELQQLDEYEIILVPIKRSESLVLDLIIAIGAILILILFQVLCCFVILPRLSGSQNGSRFLNNY